MFHLTLSNITDLEAEFRKPVAGLSIKRLANGPITAVSIVRPDGSRLTFASQMNDIGPRSEMGSLILSFEPAINGAPGPSPLLTWPQGPSAVRRLIARSDDEEAESGFVLQGHDGSELMIASAVYPYSLYLSVTDLIVDGEPEFDEQDYRYEQLL